MRYRVRWDFRKAQPSWDRHKARRFGEQNEGFMIEAESLDAARAALQEPPHRLNPFYLTIEADA